jgi:hypothetical protein
MSTKHAIGRLCTCLMLLLVVPFMANAQAIINWTGAVSTSWNNAGNWSTGVIPSAMDNVQIGIAGFTNQPTVNVNATIANLTFGGNVPVVLTVGSGYQLQVSQKITQTHNAGQIMAATTLAGGGAIQCSAIFVGNTTTPKVVKTKATTLISSVASLTVTDSLTIYSATADLLSGGIAHNNSTFSLEGGQLSVGTTIRLDNQIPAYLNSFSGSKPLSKFVINISSNTDAVLKIQKDNLFKVKNPVYAKIDFYNYSSGTGKAVVQYTGSNQTVYASTAAQIDHVPYTYQSLVIKGTGTKTVGAASGSNALNVDGDLSILSGTTLDLLSNNVTTTVNGSFDNRGGVNLGSTTIVNGTSFFNSGQFNEGSGRFQFSGSAQQLTDSTANGTVFGNVIFSKPGTKTIQGGQFAISQGGKMTVTDTAIVNVLSAGKLTLRADSTGAAAITAIPASSSITGLVTVEQFIKGGTVAGGNRRGYILLSPSVNHSGNVPGERYFSLNYINGTTDLKGCLTGGQLGPTNGFTTVGLGNPTMYIYREDKASCNANFTCGNNSPVFKINNTDPNDISTLQRFSTGSVSDTLTKVPIANGVLFYFVGNRILNNNTTAGTKTTQPFNIPESVILPNTGVVNQGNVQVRVWFRQNNYLSYTVAGFSNPRGFNLTGNPYPSPINWDKWSSSDSTKAIYGPNLTGSISVMNPITHQYNSYQADATHDPNQVYYGTGVASNIIAAGQGFQVSVSASGNPYAASLRFTENAKAVEQSPGIVAAPRLRTLSLAGRVATPAAAPQLIRLKLIKDEENQDEILIRFKVGASKQYVNSEDAYDLGGMPGITTMLSSYSGDHVPLDINCLPAGLNTTVVKLFADAVQSGTYTLTASEISGLPSGTLVLLKDLYTGKVKNLSKQADYEFSIDKTVSASYGDRFLLIIKKP